MTNQIDEPIAETMNCRRCEVPLVGYATDGTEIETLAAHCGHESLCATCIADDPCWVCEEEAAYQRAESEADERWRV